MLLKMSDRYHSFIKRMLLLSAFHRWRIWEEEELHGLRGTQLVSGGTESQSHPAELRSPLHMRMEAGRCSRRSHGRGVSPGLTGNQGWLPRETGTGTVVKSKQELSGMSREADSECYTQSVQTERQPVVPRDRTTGRAVQRPGWHRREEWGPPSYVGGLSWNFSPRLQIPPGGKRNLRCFNK